MPQPRKPATSQVPIIAIAGTKGGGGKTTVCVHLAARLGTTSRPCIVADLDPQAAATSWLLPEAPPDGFNLAHDLEAGRPMRTLPAPGVPGVRVAPGHLDLSAWDGGDARTRARLAVTLRPAEPAACVLADLPPSWGAILAGTVLASDGVLAVVECRALGLAGLSPLLDLIERAGGRLLGVVPSRRGRTRLAREVEEHLRERFQCLTTIREAAAVAEAVADGRTVAADHPAAQDFHDLAAAVRRALKGRL